MDAQPGYFGKTGISGLTTVGLLQDNALNRLLSSRTLGKLVEAEASIGNNAYQVIELLNDVKKESGLNWQDENLLIYIVVTCRNLMFQPL